MTSTEHALLPALVVVAGVATGWLTGQDGSPAWQFARVAVVLVVTVGAAYLVVRGAPVTRGTVAVLAGLPAVVAGAGISLPHLSKTGLSPAVVAGALALVAGAALAGYGSVRLVRSTRRWWRLATGAALLAVVTVGLFSGVQAVAATNVPRAQPGPGTPADRGLRYEDTTFPAPDGVALSGWYLPSAGRAAVILLHGAGSTRSDVLDQAGVLSRHGYGVLLFDARGHGRSGGRAMDFGWYGDEDVAGAIDYLRSRPDVDPDRIGAVGLSMGGEEAIGAAARWPALRAVVAEGATNRVAADWSFLADEYGVRGRIQRQVNGVTTALTDLLTAADRPITLREAVMMIAPRPVLLIAAGDVPTEVQAARYLQRGNANVQVWRVPGTGHTRACQTRPSEWRQYVTAFLDAALGRISP
ncbi:alpha/beta hydrolase [Paractinoplanes atraurantiacus]|uniref:Serine aminopeptidase, S33 n=1 Tax=Paractinoplanes atraurantiacus TaxID=1036182 RepID=A0A285JJ61_9ACTN|nr:alpha/beta fold hydrolase [Actinoplanes atraurantiacus]SNY59416.1 Serine aminopeptidase, S33 [Actinoplanes atraurantiacus]